MNMKHIVSIAVLSAFAAAAQAATVGLSSNTSNIEVKDSQAAIHGGTIGTPGIAVKTATGPFASAFSFDMYKSMGTKDANDVYTFDGVAIGKQLGGPIGTMHASLGVTKFAQVDTDAANLYFGEWNKTAGDTASHTVYYAGDNKTADMPTTGTATYSLKGVNNYDGNNQMRGKFVANFGTQTYAGNVRNSDYKVTMNGAIDTANAAFSGTAKAGSVVGVSQGNFFGANAAAVAGVATFAGRPDLDTAFGGAKQ